MLDILMMMVVFGLWDVSSGELNVMIKPIGLLLWSRR